MSVKLEHVLERKEENETQNTKSKQTIEANCLAGYTYEDV